MLYVILINKSIKKSIAIGFNWKHDEDIHALTFKQSSHVTFVCFNLLMHKFQQKEWKINQKKTPNLAAIS